MKIQIKRSLLGVKLSIGEGEELPPQRGENVSQTAPRLCYIYAHIDPSGKIFYIGRGRRRRAWDKSRHTVWHRYVEERCAGVYKVEILVDNLSESEAEEVEAEWVDYYGQQLVNWNNPGRDIDLDALNTFHRLRDANRVWVQETRPLEKSDPKEAIRRYREALKRLDEYESITLERGLIAELSDGGRYGEPQILDRLTLYLTKAGLREEALSATQQYFEKYPWARQSSLGQRIVKRVSKGPPS